MSVIEKKVKKLRNYEIYCYRICHYLLAEEQRAIEATKRTLLHILDHDDFFLINKQEQKMYVKKIATKYALQAYAISQA